MDNEPTNERVDISVKDYIKKVYGGLTQEQKEHDRKISEKVYQIPTEEEESVREIMNFTEGIDDNQLRLLALARYSQNVVNNRFNSSSRTEEEKDMAANELFESLARSLHNELYAPKRK